MVLRFRVLLLLVLGALLLPTVTAAQQPPPPVTLTVSAGYEGSYRTGQWFPITVGLTNTGKDIPNGVLEWRFLVQSDNTVFQRTIDLPQGANKQVTIGAFSNTFSRSGELRLLDGTTEILRQPVQLEPVDTRKFMIGVLSSDPALLNSLNAISLTSDSTSQVIHLDPRHLPEEAALLFGIDVLFIHDIATADLTEQQRNALALWVRLGGQLIVSGGGASDRNSIGLEDLLPVDIGGLRSDVSLEPLTTVGTQQFPNAPDAATANEVQLRPGAQARADNNLLVERPTGMGYVIFTAFDLAALRGWSSESQLWASLLQFNQRLLPGTIYRQQRESLLQTVLQLPELSLPSAGSLLLFVGLYILMIGPLNYLLLRRIKRPELAWLTIPATVLLFVIGTYVYGLLVRGGQAQVSQVTIVQGVEGQPQGQATGFVGLFSPQRGTYDLAFPADALVSETRSFSNELGNTLIRSTDVGTDVPDTLVDVSSLRTFMFEQAIPVPVQVSSALQKNGTQRVAGTVANQSSEPLEEALVVWGDAAQTLGTLQPGATAKIDLNARISNFPGGANLGTSSGRFNRQNALEALFGTATFPLFGVNTFSQGMPDPNGIYLLGWRPQPAAEIGLNGSRAAQEGTTLYIMRLNVQ